MPRPICTSNTKLPHLKSVAPFQQKFRYQEVGCTNFVFNVLSQVRFLLSKGQICNVHERQGEGIRAGLRDSEWESEKGKRKMVRGEIEEGLGGGRMASRGLISARILSWEGEAEEGADKGWMGSRGPLSGRGCKHLQPITSPCCIIQVYLQMIVCMGREGGRGV